MSIWVLEIRCFMMCQTAVWLSRSSVSKHIEFQFQKCFWKISCISNSGEFVSSFIVAVYFLVLFLDNCYFCAVGSRRGEVSWNFLNKKQNVSYCIGLCHGIFQNCYPLIFLNWGQKRVLLWDEVTFFYLGFSFKSPFVKLFEKFWICIPARSLDLHLYHLHSRYSTNLSSEIVCLVFCQKNPKPTNK